MFSLFRLLTKEAVSEVFVEEGMEGNFTFAQKKQSPVHDIFLRRAIEQHQLRKN